MSVNSVHNIVSLQRVDREVVCWGKILIQVLGSGSGIDGGDSSQGFFASTQYAGDSRYLDLVVLLPHIGIVEVMC